MHELAIVEALLETILPKAQESGAKKILEVNFHIGEMSGIVPSCIHEYFALAGKGTIAEGAKLNLKTVPAQIRCNSCGYSGVPDKKNYCCPECQSLDFRLTSGREYYIDSLLAE
ncbi:MAG: hydrogenase maturation nickel metallochaperone HypA [Parasporobacterium sp.]|nr:hydrogenase maturation nickel metallochaperone HypA [Parasporobacterium sp.]MBR3643042.1 hydrogenase maturation nickel metallochaperone HypA [Parasporobacterium sp.]